MRFLVSEKAYETPIASGRLRYERDGVPTGALETWRLTQTTHGDQILRVDFDLRAVDGRSFLYHWVMTEAMEPQRLVYRYLHDAGGELSGNVLFTDGSILNSRKLDEAHFEDELSNRPILFPTAIGAGVVARAVRRGSAEIGALDMHGNDSDLLKLIVVNAQVRPQRTRDFKIVRVGRATHRATTVTLSWEAQSYKLWLDLKHKWPLKVEREDGTIGYEARYIRYQ